ncbi:MAG: toxin-antitoxin system YwqK family antitoxin [Bacteroidota bacterium]|nr:toxin-antitoxin system YwqK family antitoxin [Bacteroidota bacterium]
MNKVHEIKNEQGIVTERITVNAGDPVEKKNGKYEKFDGNGQKIEESYYTDGKLNGVRKLFEKKYLYSLENLKDDMYHGPYFVYYPSGKIKVEGQYENNVTVGDWKAFFENGQIKETVRMSDNQENGPFKEYYPNGKLKAEGTYLEGPNEQGIISLYDSTGVLERKMDCINGICKTIWNKDSLQIN